MTGEKQGLAYEAITKYAPEKALDTEVTGQKVLWHEQPDWISIDADLGVILNHEVSKNIKDLVS